MASGLTDVHSVDVRESQTLEVAREISADSGAVKVDLLKTSLKRCQKIDDRTLGVALPRLLSDDPAFFRPDHADGFVAARFSDIDSSVELGVIIWQNLRSTRVLKPRQRKEGVLGLFREITQNTRLPQRPFFTPFPEFFVDPATSHQIGSGLI